MVKQRNGREKLENEGLFIVEAIVDRRRVEENRLQYLIKWKDYPSSHNTWEYAANIAHCKEIIAEFRELRLSEGFVDSEDEGPSPPPFPPITQTSPTSRKRRRKRKSETSSTCHSRMSDITIDQSPLQTSSSSSIPQSNSNTNIFINDNDNNGSNMQLSVQTTTAASTPTSALTPKIIPSPATTTTVIPQPSKSKQHLPISLASINLNNAIKIFAATFNHNGKYFCTLFSDGSKYWISNDNCRKYFPQLLIDYYENCSVFIEPILEQQQHTSLASTKEQQQRQQNFISSNSNTEMPYKHEKPKDIITIHENDEQLDIPESSPSSIFPEISN
uniref:Chromo domain-containing protein n=1 Tax=Panagrolaimus superbus TaxID=310955 RepID=A0A914Z5P5_9BILA